MSVLQTFKNWADTSKNHIEAIRHDHEKVCAYLHIDLTNGYARTWVTDKLKERVANTLLAGAKDVLASRATLIDLQDALIFESVLLSIDNSYYLTLLKIILSSERRIKDFTYEDDWKKAIGYAREFNSFENTYIINHTSLREAYPRQYDIGSAHKELMALGARVELNGLVLEVNALEPIIAGIEKEILYLGGINIMRALFSYLKETHRYYPAYRRYLIFNEISLIPEQAKPMVPYGFLLNLCAKYPQNKTSFKENDKSLQKRYDKLLKTATALGTILDMRVYSTFEKIYQGPEDLPKSISRLGLFDASFSFPSYDLSDILELMQNLFLWLSRERFVAEYGFAPEELLALTSYINQFSIETGPVIFSIEAFHKSLPIIGEGKIQMMLKHLSHEKGLVNKGYTFFNEYEKLDFGFKPFIKISQKKYLLCDKSWCALGFYEVFATLARGLDTRKDECNNKIGLALEEFIYRKLAEKNIKFSHGDYADGTVPNGEADALIEASKSITLIELKKKVLTRKAKTGSDIHLIIDLAASLLDAHIQTGRTELLLRTQGYVDLTLNKATTKIALEGREVERVALTQWDYGSFQDRLVINNILESLVKTELGLIKKDDEILVTAFEKINRKRELWVEQAARLSSIDPEFNHFPFFNCWFLSIPQLLVILKHVNNNEEFQEALYSTRHITLGTSNFYAEFHHAFILKKTLTTPS